MGKAIRACVLLLLLAYSASAGTMQFGSPEAPPPPPPSTQSVEEPTAEGQETTDTAVPSETLMVVRVVLSLFALL